MKKISFIAFSILIFCNITGYSQSLSTQNADTLLQHHFVDSNFVILDVCSDNAYTSGHIQNAIHHYLYSSSFSADLDTMDKSKTYLLHCTSGSMSASAMNTMATKGFTHYYDISGGITRWKSDGYLVTTNTEQSIVRFLNTKEFSDKLQKSVSPSIVDLRPDSLFSQKHLINAQNIDTTKKTLPEHLTDKTKTYFIYGTTLSKIDSTTLFNMYQNGYQHVYFLKDGFDAWEKSSMPIYKKTIITDQYLRTKNSLCTTINDQYIAIELNEATENAMFQLFTNTGYALMQGSCNRETFIPIKNLPSGIYILKITNKDLNISQTIFLN